ncbi:hypothetical protein CLV70_13027 [Pseudosporangium ferrugineum]|uniref:Uncharacterized protein n=1 Tax=Pseudosporangium ferrugineum TaxID=439699 RepID=A0A2T0RET3_9ACTN|nr:hypothetical protein CLV70_13027 [Pseudosporangium ferrugineum]
MFIQKEIHECLEFSGQFGFRVFPCNGDQRYQYTQ